MKAHQIESQSNASREDVHPQTAPNGVNQSLSYSASSSITGSSDGLNGLDITNPYIFEDHTP